MTEDNNSYNGLHFPSMEEKEPMLYQQTDSGEYVPIDKKEQQPMAEPGKTENEEKEPMLDFDGQPHDP